ncbi:MAG: hypothetical protein OXG24_05440 [Gammaproteobacteria bacterium]|nr:hypothetical protein [Gammaproteobacteria bacterium]
MSQVINRRCAHRVARSIWSAWMRFGSPRLAVADDLQNAATESSEQERLPVPSSAHPIPTETA